MTSRPEWPWRADDGSMAGAELDERERGDYPLRAGARFARWRSGGAAHAEGALRPLAAHHHRADGAAAVGGRLRLHGAPLADGDPAAVGRRVTARHRRRHRPHRDAMPDERLCRRSSGSRAKAWTSTSTILPPDPLPPPRPKPFFSILDQILRAEITDQIGQPFWIDTVGNSNLVEIRIQLDDKRSCGSSRAAARPMPPTPISSSSGWSALRWCF